MIMGSQRSIPSSILLCLLQGRDRKGRGEEEKRGKGREGKRKGREKKGGAWQGGEEEEFDKSRSLAPKSRDIAKVFSKYVPWPQTHKLSSVLHGPFTFLSLSALIYFPIQDALHRLHRNKPVSLAL